MSPWKNRRSEPQRRGGPRTWTPPIFGFLLTERPGGYNPSPLRSAGGQRTLFSRRPVSHRRHTSILRSLLAAATVLLPIACSRRPQPAIATPSSEPVRHPPGYGALLTEPRTEADWKSLGGEAAQLLSQYLQINTTNPPGN